MDEKALADVSRKMAEPTAYRTAGEARAAREKTWDECGIEEKVERLRQQLRMARDMFQYIGRTASEAKDVAINHQHNQATGAVLQEVRRHGAQMEGAGSSFDPLR